VPPTRLRQTYQVPNFASHCGFGYPKADFPAWIAVEADFGGIFSPNPIGISESLLAILGYSPVFNVYFSFRNAF
jgi:hypothetical protein